MRTHRQGPPEVWFRIFHVAPVGQNTYTEADLIEQAVEIALGPREAFETGSVATLKRRVTTDRVVNVAAKARRSAKPLRQPRTPRVVELLRKAQEWRRQLDASEVPTQAEIARREGITRARVTQVLAMLRLTPDIQERILSLPDVLGRPAITERALRQIASLEDATAQKARFQGLVETDPQALTDSQDGTSPCVSHRSPHGLTCPSTPFGSLPIEPSDSTGPTGSCSR